MSEKMGIDGLKSLISGVLKAAELGAAVADGLDLGDLGEGLAFAKAVLPAVNAVRSGLIVPELKDLDEAERAELKMFVGEEFDIEDDAVEAVIEKVLQIVIDFSVLLKAVA